MFVVLVCNIDLFFFFFSSRRRHTRCSRDWSSDVCSSDLISVLNVARFLQTLAERGHHGREPFWRRGVKKSDHRHRRLLRERREWPCCRCTSEQRDEVAPFYLIELHSVPASKSGPDCRISNRRRIVSGYWSG